MFLVLEKRLFFSDLLGTHNMFQFRNKKSGF